MQSKKEGKKNKFLQGIKKVSMHIETYSMKKSETVGLTYFYDHFEG
jgi:hypothetical protein